MEDVICIRTGLGVSRPDLLALGNWTCRSETATCRQVDLGPEECSTWLHFSSCVP